MKSIKVICDEYRQRVNNNKNDYSIGFNSIDSLIKIQSGDAVVITGRYGVGKTSFLISTISKAIDDNKSLVLFSNDLTSYQILSRLIALRTSSSLTKVILNEEDSQSIEKELSIIEKSNLFIYDGTITDKDIVESVEGIDEFDYINIDSLDRVLPSDIFDGLVTETDFDFGQKRLDIRNSEVLTDTYNKRIPDLIRTIKKQAYSKQAVVISTVSQNRLHTYRNSYEHRIEDLRKYGHLEDESDVVIILNREYGFNEVEDKEVLEVCATLAKSYRIRGIRCPLIWDEKLLAFKEVDS